MPRQGFEVNGVRRHQPARHRGHVQLVDVQVPDRRRHVAQPLESRLPPVSHHVGQGRSPQFEGRSGPSHRAPEVVQELSVHVIEKTRKILTHRREKFAQRRRQEHSCWLRAVHAGRRRCWLGLAILIVLDRTQSETDKETISPSCLFFVPTQRVHPERGRRGGRGSRFVQLEASHGLSILVVKLHLLYAPSLVRDHYQRADASHGSDRVPDRTGR